MANKKKSKPSKKKPGTKPASKKSTKTAGKRLADALAVGPCFTDRTKGERWESRVNHKGDGHFHVDKDLAQFDGDHSSGAPISGRCRGNGMDIQMRAPGAGFFNYSGNFADPGKSLIRNGTRTFVSFLSAMGLDPAPPPPGEPWEADKET